jgi:hypothetical protein
MNFSGLGGITLVVVAILWIFVFIPSWFNASAERSQEQAQVREVKRAVSAARSPIVLAPKTKVASLSEQVFRADLRVRVLSFLAWMFAFAAGALGFAVAKFAFLIPELIAAGLLALVFFRVLVMAKASQRRLLVGSIRSRAGASSTALAANARATAEAIGQVRLAQDSYRKAAAATLEWAAAREAEVREREFTVEPIPAPRYATQVGSLEAPAFAKVVELSEKVVASETAAKKSENFASTQSVDSEAITEILRRRRAANS